MRPSLSGQDVPSRLTLVFLHHLPQRYDLALEDLEDRVIALLRRITNGSVCEHKAFWQGYFECNTFLHRHLFSFFKLFDWEMEATERWINGTASQMGSHR